jgi:hypothetical protein
MTTSAECQRRAVQAFPVLGQSSASIQPTNCSLGNPALGRTKDPFAASDRLTISTLTLPHDTQQGALELWSLVVGVRIERQQEGIMPNRVPSPARHHRGPECLPNARWLEQQTLGLQGDPANRVDAIGSQVIPTIQDVFGPTLKPGGTPVLHGDVERTSLERARASNSRLPTLPYSPLLHYLCLSCAILHGAPWTSFPVDNDLARHSTGLKTRRQMPRLQPSSSPRRGLSQRGRGQDCRRTSTSCGFQERRTMGMP